MKTIKWIAPALMVCFLGFGAWVMAARKMADPTQRTGAPSHGFMILASLDATNSNPISPFVQAAGGKLFNTGGRSVFATTPSGIISTIHELVGMEGAGPIGVIQGADGNFYGVASVGGANSRGTIFKVTPGGVFALLYTFCPLDMKPCPDGAFPAANLVQASDGNFYGTTEEGGSNDTGAAFRITPGGVFRTLHSFQLADGDSPQTSLIQGSDGNLYGTASFGGSGSNPEGTVFKMSLDGSLTVLHTFNGSDGAYPEAALTQAADGNFYGTTYLGGSNPCFGGGCGTIYQISSEGRFATIHEFDKTDGFQPKSPLIQASDGKLYGVATGGGANNGGTLFRINPVGQFAIIHNFCVQGGSQCTDGVNPHGLVQYTDGAIYGATEYGGTNADGTIYRIALGLSAFVRTLPLAAQVGTIVRILGTNLTGTTSVRFHGVTANFKVKSQSSIEATVPAGATSGLVQVMTPRGTLASIVPFQVLQ